MSDAKTCGQCRHFRPDACFRHPPRPVLVEVQDHRKGGVLQEQWNLRPDVYDDTIACGEFAPVEAPQ